MMAQEKQISTPSKSTRSKREKMTKDNKQSDSNFETLEQKRTNISLKKLKKKEKEHNENICEKKTMADPKLQFRCSLPNFIDYGYPIPDGVQTIISHTPFAQLFVALRDDLISSEKSNKQLGMLLEAYDHEKDVFIFASKNFRLKTSHISKILGLSCTGKIYSKEDVPVSNFIRQTFGDVGEVKRKDVTDAINNEMKKGHDSSQDIKKRDANIARLIIVDIFMKLLFPNAKGTLHIDLVKAVEDLDQLSNYSWAKSVEMFLKKSLVSYKKYNHTYKNTGGCTLVILYWFCLKTRIIAPILGREKERHLIRKYDLQTLKKVLTNYKFRDLSAHFKDKQEDLSDSPTDDDNDIDDGSGQTETNQTSGTADVTLHEALDKRLNEQYIAFQSLFALTRKLEDDLHKAHIEIGRQNKRIKTLESYFREDSRKRNMTGDPDVEKSDKDYEKAAEGEENMMDVNEPSHSTKSCEAKDVEDGAIVVKYNRSAGTKEDTDPSHSDKSVQANDVENDTAGVIVEQSQ